MPAGACCFVIEENRGLLLTMFGPGDCLGESIVLAFPGVELAVRSI